MKGRDDDRRSVSERAEIQPKQGAKGHPVVERSVQRVEVSFMVPKRGLFGYHRGRVWEPSGECRLKRSALSIACMPYAR